MKSRILHTASLALACAIALSVTHTNAAPLELTPAPQAVLDALKRDFGLGDVVALVAASATRSSSKDYLKTRSAQFGFITTKKQGAAVVDAYTVLDKKSGVIGYSLYYRGEDGPLMIADAAVNSREKDAVDAAKKLTAAALDSVSAPGGATVYFLGIHNLDLSRTLKITVRADAQTAKGRGYFVRYSVSGR